MRTGHGLVTTGHEAAEPSGVTTTEVTRPAALDAHRWAMVSGTAGVIANVVMIVFFALAQPLGAANPRFMWLGTANDAIIVVQFAAFIPVALALLDRLPPIRTVQLATAAAVAAMGAAMTLQLLLIAGLLSFEVQVYPVTAAFAVVFGWVLSISRIGYRTGALPRRVARIGLFLGLSLPVGLFVAGVGLLIPDGVAARYIPLAIGVVVAAIGWLALPLWPLVLARFVFRKEQESVKEGLLR